MSTHHTPKLRAAETSATVSKPPTRAYPVISRHVTPSDFRTAFRSAQSGNPAKLYEIMKFFHKMDDEIPSALQSLSSAILGDNFIITPTDDSEEALRQVAVMKKVFKKMNAYELAEKLIEHHYYGLSAVQIPAKAWEALTVDGRTVQIPTYYEELPRNWLYAEKIERSDDYNTLYLGKEPLSSYDPGKVLFISSKKLPDFENLDFTDFGKGLACIRFAVFKYFNEEDAAAFNEVFATPLILGKVGPGGDRDTVQKAVNELGNAARATVNDEDSIEFIQANSGAGADTYDRSAERWNKAISKVLKSETLTNNMGQNGSYAAMYTTNGVRLDVAAYLGRKIYRVLESGIIRPVSETNFSGDLKVKVQLSIKAIEDMVTKARVFTEGNKLVPISINQVREELNLHAPEDEEDTIAVRSNNTTLGF